MKNSRAKSKAAMTSAAPAMKETQQSLATAMADQVAIAAYFKAEARGFEPGHELDDWLAAEREVH